jgi:hypothetical protein
MGASQSFSHARLEACLTSVPHRFALVEKKLERERELSVQAARDFVSIRPFLPPPSAAPEPLRVLYENA